ncbi:unnamed protein product [Triticum aestivum]|uniref:Uncharacterized protein n=1 Tax=Triticum aestivum TaxID=4565 RepID=A0A7H4LN62_WHEAT|nr:unnamed protein product [Triticum aestivum]
MSFGLVNAPPTFSRMMNFIFNPYTNEFVLVYLDDILVFSKNKEDHAKHLRLVLDKLREHKFYAKFSKCEFWLDEVLYLGHIISAKGIAVNPERVAAVVNWEPPQNVKQLRSFLGLASYCRRFVENFSKIAKPLSNLLQKHVKYVWSPECDVAFNTIKEKLVTAPVLTPPDGSKPYEVFCDASLQGLGNVIADALSRKAYCNSLILKPFQPDLCEAFRKLNLQIVPQGFLANLIVSPTLEDQIREARLLDTMVKKVKRGIDKGISKYKCYRVNDRDTLFFEDRIVVPKGDLRKVIMNEAHNSLLSIHPGNRDSIFTSKFWESFQKAMGTNIRFNTAFHPQTSGQVERVNQILEDMLRACVISFGMKWEDCLPYAEFSYNNSFQASSGKAPFEILYGRKCRAPLNWSETGERQLLGNDLISEAEEMCKVIRENLKAAQSRQKSYYDSKHRDLAFEIGDHVYLRVSPMKGTRRFGIKGKLAPRYVGPFKIIGKRGDLAYQLELPSNFANVHDVFHVSQLRKCFKTPERTVNFEEIDLQEDLSYHLHPIAILEETERKTRNKSIKFLKVKWSHHSDREATWEREDHLRSEYPEFF